MAFGLIVWRLSCGVLRASWVCGLASGVSLGEFSVVIASNASSVPSSSPPPRRSRHVSGCSVLFPFFGRCSLGFSTWAVSVEMSSSSDTLPVAVSCPGGRRRHPALLLRCFCSPAGCGVFPKPPPLRRPGLRSREPTASPTAAPRLAVIAVGVPAVIIPEPPSYLCWALTH